MFNEGQGSVWTVCEGKGQVPRVKTDMRTLGLPDAIPIERGLDFILKADLPSDSHRREILGTELT